MTTKTTKLKEFFEPNKSWLLSGTMSRGGIIAFCIFSIFLTSIFFGRGDQPVWGWLDMLWSAIGIVIAGLGLGFLRVDDDAAAADAEVALLEAQKKQVKTASESLSSDVIDHLAVLFTFFIEKLAKHITDLLSAIYSNASNLAHVCISPRLAPTPLFAC